MPGTFTAVDPASQDCGRVFPEGRAPAAGGVGELAEPAEMVGVLSSPAAWATSGGSANEIWGSSDTGPLPGSHGTRAFPDSGCRPPRLWPRNRPCLTCESSSPVGPPSRSKRSLCSDPDSPASSTRYRVIDDPRANLDASVDRTRLFRAGPDHARREHADGSRPTLLRLLPRSDSERLRDCRPPHRPTG